MAVMTSNTRAAQIPTIADMAVAACTTNAEWLDDRLPGNLRLPRDDFDTWYTDSLHRVDADNHR